MKCFCLQNYWNIRHPLIVYCTSITTQSDIPMQHLCIIAPKYGGLYRTFYDIHKTQFLSIFLVIRVQKWKLTDMLWCKLSALSKHVKLYDKLWTSLSEAPFLIEPTARPLYFILIQPKRWHFCDKINLSDSCRWKYEYTHGDKHLAFVYHVQTGISTLSLRINECPYWIKLRYVQSTHTCVQIYCGKYHFKQLNNKWVILKKCALFTGGLEVSFSIEFPSAISWANRPPRCKNVHVKYVPETKQLSILG